MHGKPSSPRLQVLKPKAGEVDVVVGTRLRLRRRVLDMSQRHLADALHITQQQLQKYETGQNRISAARLYDAARILNAPVAWFYGGLDDPEAEKKLRDVVAATGDEPASGLSDEILDRLKDHASSPQGRQELLQIMKALVDPPVG